MTFLSMLRRAGRAGALAVVLTCAFAAAAAAHARVSPAVSLSGQLQLYSLAVPTEKSGVTTTKIVLTVPAGFGIDSFVPPPAGWHQSIHQTGTGNSAVITQVTWRGGATRTGEDSLFQFLAQPAKPGDYAFGIQQTYSDGSIVNWSGPETSENPSATITAVSSFGAGGTSTLTIIALIVGILALGAGVAALVSASGRRGSARPLA